MKNSPDTGGEGGLLYQVERECNVWEVQLCFEILFTRKEIEPEDMFTFVLRDFVWSRAV